MFDDVKKAVILNRYYPLGKCPVAGCNNKVGESVMVGGRQVFKRTDQYNEFFILRGKGYTRVSVCKEHFDKAEEIAPAIFSQLQSFKVEYMQGFIDDLTEQLATATDENYKADVQKKIDHFKAKQEAYKIMPYFGVARSLQEAQLAFTKPTP